VDTSFDTTLYQEYPRTAFNHAKLSHNLFISFLIGGIIRLIHASEIVVWLGGYYLNSLPSPIISPSMF